MYKIRIIGKNAYQGKKMFYTDLDMIFDVTSIDVKAYEWTLGSYDDQGFECNCYPKPLQDLKTNYTFTGNEMNEILNKDVQIIWGTIKAYQGQKLVLVIHSIDSSFTDYYTYNQEEIIKIKKMFNTIEIEE